jgi:hypothetical protein
MKIRIKVRNLTTGSEWTEEYDKVGIGDNGNIHQAEDWAFKLIERFNAGCRPGESHRELLATELIGASTKHDWYKRTDGMSVAFRGQIVDIFECRECGITGKRFGVNGGINRDSKYRAKKYAVCGRSRPSS